MNTTSESLLLRLKQASDHLAWSRFVSLYTPLLFYWARKTGLQTQDSADLVQEVLSIVFQKLPDFKYNSERSFRGWLRTITLNKHRQWCRQHTIGEDAFPCREVPQSQQSQQSNWQNWQTTFPRSPALN